MANLVARGVVGIFDSDTGICVGVDLDGGSAANTLWYPTPTAVASSRSLTAADNGHVLECTATVSLTVPATLPAYFSCTVIPSGTTSIVSAGGTLLNGATTTLTRAAATAANAILTIQARVSAANSYVVTGS